MIEMVLHPQSTNWPMPLEQIDIQCKPSSSSSLYNNKQEEDTLHPSTETLHAMLEDSESDSDPDDSDIESDIEESLEQQVESSPPSPPSPPRRTSSPLSSSFTTWSDADDHQAESHTYTVHYSPPRHQYAHHGYSRLGLGHIRWFWSLREDAWAYDGLGQPEPIPHRQTCPESMHPRRGDISALRDPYCAHVDRCFARLPVWTMAKTLWMFDVHVGSTAKPSPSSGSDSETDDELGASRTSSKSKTSDDSDATLVESESEDGWSVVSPTPPTSVSSPTSQPSHTSYFENKKLVLQVEEEEDEGDEEEVDVVEQDSSDEEEDDDDDDDDEYACVPRVWATNWYRRWELLIRLVRLDQERKRARAARILQGESEPDKDSEGVGT